MSAHARPLLKLAAQLSRLAFQLLALGSLVLQHRAHRLGQRLRERSISRAPCVAACRPAISEMPSSQKGEHDRARDASRRDHIDQVVRGKRE